MEQKKEYSILFVNNGRFKLFENLTFEDIKTIYNNIEKECFINVYKNDRKYTKNFLKKVNR